MCRWNQGCCFIPCRVHLLHHLLYPYLLRIVGNSGLFGSKVDIRILDTRKLLQPLFDSHGTGSAGHALECEDSMTLFTCLILRINCMFYRLFRFCRHGLFLLSSGCDEPMNWLSTDKSVLYISYTHTPLVGVYIKYSLFLPALSNVHKSSICSLVTLQVTLLLTPHCLRQFAKVLYGWWTLPP